jgi:uncharacterized protein (DUF952 family)
MAEIYHMVPVGDWVAARGGEWYEAASLASEGFIHCTVGERNLLGVAGRYYAGEPGDWLVLVIDPAQVRTEVRWELQPDGLAYPHIYGPLNVDAVTDVRRFPRDAGGGFLPFRDAERFT